MLSGRFILAASISLHWISLYTYLPILPTYARDIGASYEMIGIIVGAYGFTQMALRLPLGIISDRLNMRRAFLLAGAALFALQIIGGFGRGILFPLMLGLSIGGVGGDRQATAMGFFQAAYGAGMVLGPLLAGWLSEAAGLDWAFWAAGLAGVAGTAVALAVAPPGAKARERQC